MDRRLRIAFGACAGTMPALERVASRFAAVAEVMPFAVAPDGSDADALVPELRQITPDAIVAPPKPATRFVEAGVDAPTLQIEIPADVVLGRVMTALERASSVGVITPAGMLAPSTCRLLRRLGGEIHVLPYDSDEHLRDLVVRCQRMGIGAVVGDEPTRLLATAAGLFGLSVVDEPDEPAGMLAQAIVKATAQVAPRHAGRGEELVRLGLILEKIAQGVIGPWDTALCLDHRGQVTATFAPPAANGTGRTLALARPGELSLMEAVATSVEHGTAEADEAPRPVALDFYTLAAAAGGGYLAVLRGSPRAVAVLPDGPGPAEGDPRAARLLERVDGLTKTKRVRRPPRRFLASLRRRTFLLDWDRVRYFELRSGLVYASLATGETYATNYTLVDIAARVDARDFFRIHRHVIVNLNYVTELERYGVSQFRVLLEGPEAPAFVVSRPASAALRKLLKY